MGSGGVQNKRHKYLRYLSCTYLRIEEEVKEKTGLNGVNDVILLHQHHRQQNIPLTLKGVRFYQENFTRCLDLCYVNQLHLAYHRLKIFPLL